MSKAEQDLPELDIPDEEDDVTTQKDLFDLPPKLKKASKAAKEAELREQEGEEEDEEGEEEDEEGEEIPPSEEGKAGEEVQPSEGEDATQPPSEGDTGQKKEDEEGDEEGVEPEEIADTIAEAVTDEEGGISKSEMGSMEDLSIPEQIMEEIMGGFKRKGEPETEMPLEEMAGSIVEEIVTGKKPTRRKKKEMSAKEIAESIATEIVTGERPEEPIGEEEDEKPAEGLAREIFSEVEPLPQDIAEGITEDILSSDYTVKRVLGEALPGQKETKLAKGMVSVMIPGHIDESMDEDVTQYIWEGPCSSSSSSTEKGDKIDEYGKYDKENLIEIYKGMFKDKFILSRKNTFLQKKVYEFYRLKKLTNYFDSIDDDEKLENKYTKELKLFEEYISHDRDRRAQINMEIQELEVQLQEAEERLENSLKYLLERERECGVGLLSEKGGKVLNEKVVERLLRRQKESVTKLLVGLQKYIRLRDKLENKEKQLLLLETIGVEYYLRDYEQLQMENQSYSDKIEERDEELTRLRLNATSSMQTLAHIREKANYTTIMINDLFESLEMVEVHANEIREHIQLLKKMREKLRKTTHKKKLDAGLLVHHRLVKHFETSIEESATLQREIEDFKSLFNAKKRTLSALRLSLLEVKRHSLRPAWKQKIDYKIFKELLYDKRTQMPNDDELFRREMERAENMSFDDPHMSSLDKHSGDHHFKSNKVEPITKSRPNFFPKGKMTLIGSYIS